MDASVWGYIWLQTREKEIHQNKDTSANTQKPPHRATEEEAKVGRDRQWTHRRTVFSFISDEGNAKER